MLSRVVTLFSLFGISTADQIRSGCYEVASALAPNKPTLTPVMDHASPQEDYLNN
jgi:hypothetical protein